MKESFSLLGNREGCWQFHGGTTGALWFQSRIPKAAFTYLLKYHDSFWRYPEPFNSSFQPLLWLFCSETWTTSGDICVLEAVKTFWQHIEKNSEMTAGIMHSFNGHAKIWKEVSKTVMMFCSAYPSHPWCTFYVPLAPWEYPCSLFSTVPIFPNPLHEQSEG